MFKFHFPSVQCKSNKLTIHQVSGSVLSYSCPVLQLSNQKNLAEKLEISLNILVACFLLHLQMHIDRVPLLLDREYSTWNFCQNTQTTAGMLALVNRRCQLENFKSYSFFLFVRHFIEKNTLGSGVCSHIRIKKSTCWIKNFSNV